MEDKELVENILSGNFSLYKEIMKRYWGMVFANLHRYVVDPQKGDIAFFI